MFLPYGVAVKVLVVVKAEIYLTIYGGDPRPEQRVHEVVHITRLGEAVA